MDLLTFATTFTISIVTLLTLFHLYVHGNRVGRAVDKIPGPKWYPIIGNALDIMVPLENIWHFLRRSARDFYPINKFWIGAWGVVNIRHPDDVEILLSSNKNIRKSLFYDFLHPWLADGLLTSTGDKWKSRRKILTPAFHLNNLQEYMGSMNEHADRLTNALREEAKNSGSVKKEVAPLLTKYTLDTICEAAMGMTMTEHDKGQNEYKRAIYDIGNMFYYRAVRPWLKLDCIFSMTALGKASDKAVEVLHNFSAKIINEREEYHRETGGKYLEPGTFRATNDVNSEIDGKIKRKRLAFLDLMLADSKKNGGIDKQGIQEEVDTFVFEGHDTTAMGLCFTVLLLAEHKDVQERIRQEVDKVLRQSDGEFTTGALQECQYLERCLKESLRLYPSVPSISRKIDVDMQLKHAFVPKGTIVNIHIVDTHRDPNFWPRPNIFDPDRFLPENMVNRHPFSYIPFSAGPRNCIGQKFAMLELKRLIAGLIHNFYLEPQDQAAAVRILPDLVLRTSHPVHVKFIPIEKKK